MTKINRTRLVDLMIEAAERLVNGRIEGQLPCDETGCQISPLSPRNELIK
jgi:hypothetical protein